MHTSALVQFVLCVEPLITRPAIILEGDPETGRATLRIFTLPKDEEHFYADELFACRKGSVDREAVMRGTAAGQWHE